MIIKRGLYMIVLIQCHNAHNNNLLNSLFLFRLPCIDDGAAGLLDRGRVRPLATFCFSFAFIGWACSSSLADSVAES